MTQELLPCPFCGGEAYTSEGDERWFVGCSDCYCNVGEVYDRSAMPEHIYATETEAVAAWNTRTLDPEALRSMVLQQGANAAKAAKEYAEEVERLREALMPFARIAMMDHRKPKDAPTTINVELCRAARQALAGPA